MLKKSVGRTEKRQQEETAGKRGENLPVAATPREDMRRYSRSQLLEVILLQAKENDGLKAELVRLTEELTDKRLTVERAGNIAEASLALNKVFENAEEAVAQYKENLKRMSENREALEAGMAAEARRKAEEIIAEAEAKASAMTAQAKAQAERSRIEADAYWEELSGKLERLYAEKQGLREIVKALGGAGRA